MCHPSCCVAGSTPSNQATTHQLAGKFRGCTPVPQRPPAKERLRIGGGCARMDHQRRRPAPCHLRAHAKVLIRLAASLTPCCRRSCAAQAYHCAAESPNCLPNVARRGGASRAHLRGSCAACQDDGGAHVARDDVKDGARLQAEAIAQIKCPMRAAFQMNWVLSLAHKGRLLRSTCPRGPYGMIVIHRSQLHGHTEHAPAAAG